MERPLRAFSSSVYELVSERQIAQNKYKPRVSDLSQKVSRLKRPDSTLSLLQQLAAICQPSGFYTDTFSEDERP